MLIKNATGTFVAVTGIMTPEQTRRITNDTTVMGRPRVALAVRANQQTIEGSAQDLPGRYPAVDQIAAIFSASPLTFNLIDFSTDEPATLLNQLNAITYSGGPHLHGLQLGMVWPDPQVLARYRTRYGSVNQVLGVGYGCFQSVGRSPQALADRIYREYEVADHVVIGQDQGGPLDAEIALKCAFALRQVVNNMLSPLKIGLAVPLDDMSYALGMARKRGCWPVSLDASASLLGEDGEQLDLAQTRAYLASASALMA